MLTFHPKPDIITCDATVAQSVEQLIRNQQAAGSSPASSSKKRVRIYAPFFPYIKTGCAFFDASGLCISMVLFQTGSPVESGHNPKRNHSFDPDF